MLQSAVMVASDAVARRYFRAGQPTAWHREATL
jgi:hypothetical protein